MKINGKAAQSGTLVIGPGQSAELDLPFGSFQLLFNPSIQPQNVQLTTTPPQIVFDGMDNTLGVGTSLTIPLQNGFVTLTIVIHSLGDGSSVYRIINYTVA